MKWILNLFRRKHPKHLKNVWWNGSVHLSDKYPKVFSPDGNYIPCKVGANVVMSVGKDGEKAVYTVTRVWQDRPWSDWMYYSDCIHCDMKYSHLEKAEPSINKNLN